MSKTHRRHRPTFGPRVGHANKGLRRSHDKFFQDETLSNFSPRRMLVLSALAKPFGRGPRPPSRRA